MTLDSLHETKDHCDTEEGIQYCNQLDDMLVQELKKGLPLEVRMEDDSFLEDLEAFEGVDFTLLTIVNCY